MKRILFFSSLVCLSLTAFKAQAQNYAKQNISFIGNWYDPSVIQENTYGIKYQAVVGYAQNSKEYAVIGSTAGTYFIEVTNPASPTKRWYIKGKHNGCIWHEFAIYGKYIYIVSDDSSPNSLQIGDLSYLPDSVRTVYDGTTLFERSHTVFVDNGRLYCGGVTKAGGAGSYSMAVYDLTNPVAPVLKRALNQDYPSTSYVHDMFVRNDTVYASAGYQGLFIYKYDAINNKFVALDQLTNYPEQGYNHSGSLTDNGKVYIFCDEVPAGKAVKALDVSQFGNLSVKSTFKSNVGDTPHNPYVVGNNRAVIASYQDGVQIFDISNPSVVVKTGFFDTDTLHGLNDGYTFQAYHGCWGAYPYLPSKVLLVSDMQNGLYTLNASVAMGITTGVDHQSMVNSLNVYPDPFQNQVTLDIWMSQPGKITYQVLDITGRMILNGEQNCMGGNSTIELNTSEFSSGVYLLKMTGNGVSTTQKMVRN